MTHLTALGYSANNAIILNIIGIVSLDIGRKTIEGTLDGFLGG